MIERNFKKFEILLFDKTIQTIQLLQNWST